MDFSEEELGISVLLFLLFGISVNRYYKCSFVAALREVKVHDEIVTGKFLHNFYQYYNSSISQVITNNFQRNSDLKTKICPIEIT